MASLVFESNVCSRCGGSGHYSYCQRWGTVCFKCAGRTVVLTKRGNAAQRVYTRLLSRAARTLQPGDQMWDTVVTMNGIGSKWYRVESVETMNNGTLCIHTEGMTFAGVNPDKQIRVRAANQDVRRWATMIALAYQDILSKTGKEPKWLGTIAWG